MFPFIVVFSYKRYRLPSLLVVHRSKERRKKVRERHNSHYRQKRLEKYQKIERYFKRVSVSFAGLDRMFFGFLVSVKSKSVQSFWGLEHVGCCF